MKARGLSAVGNKNELMERLQNALKNKTEDSAGGESVDDLEEDLLNVSYMLLYLYHLLMLAFLLRWMMMNI